MPKTKNQIVVTPELLIKAFEDAKEGMFPDNDDWTVSNPESFQIDMGFITLKNGDEALVSIRIDKDLNN